MLLFLYKIKRLPNIYIFSSLLTPEDLVKEDLDVVWTEMLWTDDYLVKIALQQLRYHVSVYRLPVKETIDWQVAITRSRSVSLVQT